MNVRIRKWLLDVLEAINAIEGFLKMEKIAVFSDYCANLMLKRAVERELEIVGEAINRILHKKPDISISNAKKIVGLRNHIIHVYDHVSDEIVWGVIIRYLPLLKNEIKTLLHEEYKENQD